MHCANDQAAHYGCGTYGSQSIRATGRALFFLNRPLNDSLVKALPAIVQEIRAVVPTEPVTLIFDRGGYSGAGFRALTEQGIGFITYLKGRKARRRFPSDRFVRRWWQFDDPAGIHKRQRQVYRLYERGTRIRDAGVVRTLVMEDAEGQIPILTNCAQMPAAKLSICSACGGVKKTASNTCRRTTGSNRSFSMG